jgi:HEAT repeat protein
MRSSDPDERLRGIQRAAALQSPEALALLERAARPGGPGGLDPRMPDEGMARKDSRALLAVVRGLAGWLPPGRPSPQAERARTALQDVLRAPSDVYTAKPASIVQTAGIADPAAAEAEGAARITLARQEAAIALAGSGSQAALEQLVTTARSGGPGQEAALVGLTVHPPVDPSSLGGVALTTAGTIALAMRVGDLRALDPILGIVKASDPTLRAAAITALGVAGDARGLEPARAGVHDEDARVRVACAETLARLAANDAPAAIEALIEDETTAGEGLHLAQLVQDEGVIKAAAARAAASGDTSIRSAAIAALGRQAAPSAVQALVALAAGPYTASEAAAAIARSPSPSAIAGIESIAQPGGPARRLAARAYFVRRYTRGERSRALDGILTSLALADDPRDRAVGTEALVALGEQPLDRPLADPDPRVRRAAALGALGAWSPSAAKSLSARAAAETDSTTRAVLALGWRDPRGADTVPASELLDRANSGGADAPLAAFALAQRPDEPLAPLIDVLLASHDPALRAATARGLGWSPAPEATGRLAEAYEWESDPAVRQALIAALALRGDEQGGKPREETLALAARLDPNLRTRWIAASALGGTTATAVDISPGEREIAWLRLVPAEGTSPTLDVPARLDQGGCAVPIAFDDEGYALIPGMSAGEARLRLAPGLPAYSPPAP